MTVHGVNLLLCSHHHEPQCSSRRNPEAQDQLRVFPSPCIEVSFDWSDFPVLLQHSHADLLDKPQDNQETAMNSSPDFDSYPSSEWTYSSQSSSSFEVDDAVADDDLSVDSCLAELSDLDASVKTRKSVSFHHTVSVREYSRVVGDHPFCSALPLSLGWEFNEGQALIQSPSAGPSQRPHVPYRLNYYERRNLLRKVGGLTEDELRLAEARHRAHSRLNCQLHHVATSSQLFGACSMDI